MADIGRLMDIYGSAKVFMAATGNPGQWIDGYPRRGLIESDIENGYCHVMEEDGVVEAVFALIPGDDPTYRQIFGGQWINDKPYAVVHGLASSGKVKGVGEMCLRWCLEMYSNLRVDTHADNRVMQNILDKMKFCRCGIIYTHNGTPRIAYQKDLSEQAPRDSEACHYDGHHAHQLDEDVEARP